MWLVENAEHVLIALKELADRHSLTIYEGVPRGSGRTVSWRRPDSVDEFVGTGAKVGVQLLYVEAARAADLIEHEDVAVPDDRYDEIVMAIGAWVKEGVTHKLQVISRWWDDLATTHQFRSELEAHDEDARIDQMARQVVDHKAFHDHGGHGREARQIAVVEAAFPDSDEGTRWRVLHRAIRIDQTERQPQREAEWASEARGHIRHGETKRKTAELLGISVNVLNRVLQQNPQDASDSS